MSVLTLDKPVFKIEVYILLLHDMYLHVRVCDDNKFNFIIKLYRLQQLPLFSFLTDDEVPAPCSDGVVSDVGVQGKGLPQAEPSLSSEMTIV